MYKQTKYYRVIQEGECIGKICQKCKKKEKVNYLESLNIILFYILHIQLCFLFFQK